MAGVKLGDQSFYFRRQMLTSAIGLFGMFVLSRIDYRIWKKMYGLIYFAGLLLCILLTSRLLDGFLFGLFLLGARLSCCFHNKLFQLCRLFKVVCRSGVSTAVNLVNESRAIRICRPVLRRCSKQESDSHRVTVSLDVHVNILAGCTKTVIDRKTFGHLAPRAMNVKLEIRFIRIVSKELLHELKREYSLRSVPAVPPFVVFVGDYIVFLLLP